VANDVAAGSIGGVGKRDAWRRAPHRAVNNGSGVSVSWRIMANVPPSVWQPRGTARDNDNGVAKRHYVTISCHLALASHSNVWRGSLTSCGW